MNPEAAAQRIWAAWSAGEVLDSLPSDERPVTLADGFSIQSCLPRVSGQLVAGWKLAATNPTGQAHIGVDGPLPGRLLQDKVLEDGASVAVQANRMRVAEAEFAFTLSHDLPPIKIDYDLAAVRAATASVHPCIEVPDSRLADFAAAGAAQLAADCACAQWFVKGAPGRFDGVDLAAHPVKLLVNGAMAVQGSGADVLGSPWNSLLWLANAHEITGGLQAGQIITTGVCGQPAPIRPGDQVEVDMGVLGSVHATMT